jgi:hypothetical protein
MTPENSVVNGADTSTDGSIECAALSAKNRVAPLLVKTREVTSEMLKFFDELTTQMRCTRRSAASEDEDSRKRRSLVLAAITCLCAWSKVLENGQHTIPVRRDRVPEMGTLPDLHRISYTQNLPVRQ